MSEKTRLALEIGGLALVAGLLGDWLFRTANAPGLNVSLWVAVVIVGLYLLSRRHDLGLLAGEGRWLLLPAAALAAGLAWRTTEGLVVLTILALVVVMALIVAYAREGSLRESGILDWVLSGIMAGVNTVFGPLVLLFGDVAWGELPKGRVTSQVAAVIKGLLIAVPLLLIFGNLFRSADPVFGRLITQLFHWNLDTLFEHIFIIGFTGWLAGGFLRAALLAKRPDVSNIGRPSALAIGPTEAAIVLGLLNVLFLSFVAVQFRYFFGGAALVEQLTDLTFADYARSGFFELVTVAALVLPTLLFGHWLLPADSPAQVRVFRPMAGFLLALVGVILVSAVQRMRLYQEAYGLTEARLYATALLIWVGMLLAWFAYTVLRGRRERFIFGALVSGLAILTGLYAMNPDALIVKTNIARYSAGRELDAQYISYLSSDAVPALLDALPAMPPEQQKLVAARLTDLHRSYQEDGWRSWNWSRFQAARALDAHSPQLKELLIKP